jgi:hypothetical protein
MALTRACSLHRLRACHRPQHLSLRNGRLCTALLSPDQTTRTGHRGAVIARHGRCGTHAVRVGHPHSLARPCPPAALDACVLRWRQDRRDGPRVPLALGVLHSLAEPGGMRCRSYQPHSRRVRPLVDRGTPLRYNAGQAACSRQGGARYRTVDQVRRCHDGTAGPTPAHDQRPPLGRQCCLRHARGDAAGRLHAVTRRSPDRCDCPPGARRSRPRG